MSRVFANGQGDLGSITGRVIPKNLVSFALVGFYGILTYSRLFNAKSSLYIYIKYIWFSLVGKDFKMVLDIYLLNTQQYKLRIKGKVEQSWEGVVPSPTLRCSSYWKGSLLFVLDYGHQLYFPYIRDFGKKEMIQDMLWGKWFPLLLGYFFIVSF